MCLDVNKDGLGEKISKKVLKESPVVIVPRPVVNKAPKVSKSNEVKPKNDFTKALEDMIPIITESFNNKSPQKSSGTGRFHQRGIARKNEQQSRQAGKVSGEKITELEAGRPVKRVIPVRPVYNPEEFKKELTISLEQYTENFYKNPSNYDLKEKNGEQKIAFDGIIPDNAETLSKGDVALLWLEETSPPPSPR